MDKILTRPVVHEQYQVGIAILSMDCFTDLDLSPNPA